MAGWEGKSDLATRIRNEAGVAVITDIPSAAECVAIDAMFLMNQISTKPMWVKNGSDLAKEFCNRMVIRGKFETAGMEGKKWQRQ